MWLRNLVTFFAYFCSQYGSHFRIKTSQFEIFLRNFKMAHILEMSKYDFFNFLAFIFLHQPYWQNSTNLRVKLYIFVWTCLDYH